MVVPQPGSTVGLIGLGLMGTALAARLRAAGWNVLGFDLQPAGGEYLRELGGEVAADAGDVLSACDLVLISVTDHHAVQSLFDMHSATLRPGQTIVDTTTGSPESAVRMAGQLAGRDVVYLDATISGSSAQLRAGDVLWMVGGDRKAFDHCAEIWRCLARETVYTGPTGSGSKMKLVTNLVLGLNRAALAEGLVLGQSLGLDAVQTLAVLRASAAYSRTMDSKGEKMIHADFAPVARLSQHLKDVRLMLAEAAAAGATLPFSQTHVTLLEAAEAQGLGSLDNSAIYKVIAAGRDP